MVEIAAQHGLWLAGGAEEAYRRLAVERIVHLPAGDLVLKAEKLLTRKGALPLAERGRIDLGGDAEQVADQGVVKNLRRAGCAGALHQKQPAHERCWEGVIQFRPVGSCLVEGHRIKKRKQE